MKRIFFILSIAVTFTACSPSAPTPPVTNSVQYPLPVAINTTTSGSDLYTMDLKTHAYSFTPQANITINKLGYYYNNPNLASASFTLDLWDATAGSPPIASTGSQIFTPNISTVYISISPVTLTAGQTYYISRHYTGTGNGPASDYIGYIHMMPNLFPLSLSTLTPAITFNQSYFTDNPDPRTANPNGFGYQTYLPWIDFEFQ